MKIDQQHQSFSKPNATCCARYVVIAFFIWTSFFFSFAIPAAAQTTTDGCPLAKTGGVIDLNVHNHVTLAQDCLLEDVLVDVKGPLPPQTATLFVDGLTMVGGALNLLGALNGDGDLVLQGISITVTQTTVLNASGFFSAHDPLLVSAADIDVSVSDSDIDVPFGNAFSFLANNVDGLSVVATAGANITASGMVCSCAASDAASGIQLHALNGTTVHTNGSAAFSIIRTNRGVSVPTFPVSNVSLAVLVVAVVEVTNVNELPNECAAVASICSTIPTNDATLIIHNVSLAVEVENSTSSIVSTALGYYYSTPTVAGISLICSTAATNCVVDVVGNLFMSATAHKQATIVVSMVEGPAIVLYFSCALAGIAVNSQGVTGGVTGVNITAARSHSDDQFGIHSQVVATQDAHITVDPLTTVVYLVMSISSVGALGLDSNAFIETSPLLERSDHFDHRHVVSVLEGSALILGLQNGGYETVAAIAGIAARSRYGSALVTADDVSLHTTIADQSSFIANADKVIKIYLTVCISGIAATSSWEDATALIGGSNATSLQLSISNDVFVYIKLLIQHINYHTAVAIASVMSSSGRADVNVMLGVTAPTLSTDATIADDVVLYVSGFDRAAIAISSLCAYTTGVETTSSASIVLNNTNVQLTSVAQNNVSLTIYLPGVMYNSFPVSSIVAFSWKSTAAITTNNDTTLTLTTNISQHCALDIASRSGAIAASSLASYSTNSARSEVKLSPATSVAFHFFVDGHSTFMARMYHVYNLIAFGSIVSFATETATAVLDHNASSSSSMDPTPQDVGALSLHCFVGNHSKVALSMGSPGGQQNTAVLHCGIAALTPTVYTGRGFTHFTLEAPTTLRSVVDGDSELNYPNWGKYSCVAIAALAAIGVGVMDVGGPMALESIASARSTLYLRGNYGSIIAVSSVAYLSSTDEGGGIRIAPNTTLRLHTAALDHTDVTTHLTLEMALIAVASVASHNLLQDDEISLPDTSTISMIFALANTSTHSVTFARGFLNNVALASVSSWNHDDLTYASTVAITLHGHVSTRVALLRDSVLSFYDDSDQMAEDSNSIAIGSVVSYSEKSGTSRQHLLLNAPVTQECVLDQNAAMTYESRNRRIDNALSLCSVVTRTISGGELAMTNTAHITLHLFIAASAKMDLKTNCRQDCLIAITSVMAWGTFAPSVAIEGLLDIKTLVQSDASMHVDTFAQTITGRSTTAVASVMLWAGDLFVSNSGKINIEIAIVGNSSVNLNVRWWPTISILPSYEAACSLGGISTLRTKAISLSSGSMITSRIVLQNSSNVTVSAPKNFAALVASVAAKEIVHDVSFGQPMTPVPVFTTTIVLVEHSFIHQYGSILPTKLIVDSGWFWLPVGENPLSAPLDATFCRTEESPLPSSFEPTEIAFLDTSHPTTNFSVHNGTITSLDDLTAPLPCQHAQWAPLTYTPVGEVGQQIVEAVLSSADVAEPPANRVPTPTVSASALPTSSTTLTMNVDPSPPPATTTPVPPVVVATPVPTTAAPASPAPTPVPGPNQPATTPAPPLSTPQPTPIPGAATATPAPSTSQHPVVPTPAPPPTVAPTPAPLAEVTNVDTTIVQNGPLTGGSTFAVSIAVSVLPGFWLPGCYIDVYISHGYILRQLDQSLCLEVQVMAGVAWRCSFAPGSLTEIEFDVNLGHALTDSDTELVVNVTTFAALSNSSSSSSEREATTLTLITTVPIVPPSVAATFSVLRTVPPTSEASLGDVIVFEGTGFTHSMPHRVIIGPFLVVVHVVDGTRAWAQLPPQFNNTVPTNPADFNAVEFLVHNLPARPRGSTTLEEQDRKLLELLLLMEPETSVALCALLYGDQHTMNSTLHSNESSAGSSPSEGSIGEPITSSSELPAAQQATSPTPPTGDLDTSSNSNDDNGDNSTTPSIEVISLRDTSKTPLPFSVGINFGPFGGIVFAPTVTLHSVGCVDGTSALSLYGGRNSDALLPSNHTTSTTRIDELNFKKFENTFAPGKIGLRFVVNSSNTNNTLRLISDALVTFVAVHNDSVLHTNSSIAPIVPSIVDVTSTGAVVVLFVLDVSESAPPPSLPDRSSSVLVDFRIRMDMPALFQVYWWEVTMLYRAVNIAPILTHVSRFSGGVSMNVLDVGRIVHNIHVSISLFRPIIALTLVSTSEHCEANSAGNQLSCVLTDVFQHKDPNDLRPDLIRFSASGVPSYYQPDVAVIISVSGVNIQTASLIGYVKTEASHARQPLANVSTFYNYGGGGGNGDGSGVPPPGGDSGGEIGAPPRGPQVDLITPTAQTNAPTPQPPVNALAGGADTIRGIFDPTRCVGYFHFLIYAIIAYIITLVLRYLVDKIRIRNAGGVHACQEMTETVSVSATTVAIRRHVWVGVIAPCHCFCGISHVNMLFAHLALYLAISTAFIEHALAPLGSDTAKALFIAVFSAIFSSFSTPVLNYYFTLENETKVCNEKEARVRKYLTEAADAMNEEENAHNGTQNALMNFNSVGEFEIVSHSADNNHHEVDDDAPTTTGSGEDAGACTHHQHPEQQDETSTTAESSEDVPCAHYNNKNRNDLDFSFTTDNVLVVDSKGPTRIGTILALMMIAFFLFVTYFNSAHWCTPNILFFYRVCVVGLPVDVLIVQTLYATLTYVNAWVTSPGEEEEQEVEVEGPADSEDPAVFSNYQLHPIHEQQRKIN